MKLVKRLMGLNGDQRGLTAIELAVVVAILAVLAAIVAGNTAGMSTAARGSSLATDKAEVQKAVDNYRGQHPKSLYPTGDGTISATPGVTTNIKFDAGYVTNDATPVAKKFVPDFLQREVKHASDPGLNTSGTPVAGNTWAIDDQGQVVVNRTADQY